MKIEKLTDNKIRIILNIDDLAKKNIDVHSLIKNTDGTQIFLKNILKEAQKEVGFEVDDSKLLIEAFISTEGFFVLTFTKIDNNSVSKKHNVPTPKAKRKIIDSSTNFAIYKFNTFDEFCSFCTYINNSSLNNITKLAKKISLYEYKSEYFLVLSEIHTDFKELSLFYIMISEFAKLASNSPSFIATLSEYGNILFKNNAIKNGINYFSKA